VTGGCITLHKEVRHNLYSSALGRPNEDGLCSTVGEMGNGYKTLVKERGCLGDIGVDGKIISKLVTKKWDLRLTGS
jgi:hypothetical protein